MDWPLSAVDNLASHLVLWAFLGERAMENQCVVNQSGNSSLVLVVDDDLTTRNLHRAILARQFDVITASTGAEALTLCQERLPDLVLLDVEMPELNGYDTCRRLREWASIPIIFATAHQSLDEHLKAFDAGGSDIVTKPVNRDILLRKVDLAIRHHQTQLQLVEEKASLHKMAMEFLSSMGHNGTLLTFMRRGLGCRNHRALAECLLEAVHELDVECTVLLRHGDGPTVLTTHGDPTPLEYSILEQSSQMGRLFQFGRRMVVNYDRVSIIIANMPDEKVFPEQAGRIRDNVAILAETGEALCDNVDMRMESMQRAEQLQLALGGAVNAVESLRNKYFSMLGDTRILLQELTDNVERSYSWLETNHSQEIAISETMDQSVQKILTLLAEGGDFERQFGEVLTALRNNEDQQDNLEFF